MKTSKESYDFVNNTNFKWIESNPKPYLKYIVHVIGKILTKQKPKQWRQISFEIIGEKEKSFEPNEIFRFKRKDYNFLKKLTFGNGKKIIIHTGSGWEIKFLENEKWVEILKRVNKLGKFQFIFVGATEMEEKTFKEISKQLNFKIYSLIGKINTLELFLLMKKSYCFMGVDSGPRHIAHAAELPSINLLGPGPKFFMPYNKRDIVIDKSNCMCTNLFCYKRNTCMQKISTNEVFEAFKKLSKTI